MARERMVTRTITTTEVTALCINIETSDVTTETFTFSMLVKDEKTMIHNAQAQCEKDVKVVAIKSVKENEILYGMPELEFIKLAKVLPSR